jgi:threonine/homoserine/homoserine lactone efflux protein
MPSVDLLITFFIAASIFAFVPGTGMLYAATQTVGRGRRAGWLSAVGFHVAGYVHVLAAALGFVILLKAIPSLYALMKFAGAAYLIWLGIKLFMSKEVTASSPSLTAPVSDRCALWDSVIVELLNPKSALFFLAFLPQFTEPSASLPIWLQILLLGTVVNLMFSATDILCVLLSARMSKLFIASQSASRLARRAGGGILIALGVNLAALRSGGGF